MSHIALYAHWRRLADGYLRLLSLEHLCQTSEAGSIPHDPIKRSDRPLSGYITGFHIVTNFRTSERYIVGGADDGSVAFWSMKYVDSSV